MRRKRQRNNFEISSVSMKCMDKSSEREQITLLKQGYFKPEMRDIEKGQ